MGCLSVRPVGANGERQVSQGEQLVQVYLVGGAVRDRLLGRSVNERDWVVVGSTEDEMLAQGFRRVGRDFPVFLHPQTGEEYALARTERKRGRGHRGFDVQASPDVTLEADLSRRDLSVNAIAQADDGTLIDPYGGIEDLRARRLRHLSPAFAEDPLRVLRVARFWARYAELGFRVAEQTWELMTQMSRSGELDSLTPERVWGEFQRALDEPQPERFVELLRRCEALPVLFPEFARLYAVAMPDGSSPSVGLHCEEALAAAARSGAQSEQRFAAWVADLTAAPPACIANDTSKGRGAADAELQRWCRRVRAPNRFRETAAAMVRGLACAASAGLGPTSVLEVLEALDALRRPERLDDFLVVRAAHQSARGEGAGCDAPFWRTALEHARAVSARHHVQAGLSGEQIADRLRQDRLTALKALIEARRKA